MSDAERAVGALRSGALVVLPTDTVYGVGALPDSAGGIDKLFEVKGRPREKAIPILAASFDDLHEVGTFDARASALAEAFWPGALTMVLPRHRRFTIDLGGTDAKTVAVRIPGDKTTQQILKQTGPLAVTSANHSGDPAATTVEAAREALGDAVEVYVDGGRVRGKGSTVVSLVGELRCLREGDLPFQEIARRVGGIGS